MLLFMSCAWLTSDMRVTSTLQCTVNCWNLDSKSEWVRICAINRTSIRLWDYFNFSIVHPGTKKKKRVFKLLYINDIQCSTVSILNYIPVGIVTNIYKFCLFVLFDAQTYRIHCIQSWQYTGKPLKPGILEITCSQLTYIVTTIRLCARLSL